MKFKLTKEQYIDWLIKDDDTYHRNLYQEDLFERIEALMMFGIKGYHHMTIKELHDEYDERMIDYQEKVDKQYLLDEDDVRLFEM
tara:strand:- start:963 stop:1217 length:255 start_codon:yes stop_codon:yes gene_type:complete